MRSGKSSHLFVHSFISYEVKMATLINVDFFSI
jgi:hypothetical protein